MLNKVLVVILLGAAPWGGIWFPSTAGIALGLGLPTAVGLSTAGQFGGVLAVLGAVSKAEDNPKVAELRSVISKYRKRAYRQVLREFPSLRDAERILSRNKMNRRLGRDTETIENILNY